jgi:hypothetical protein
LRERIEERRNGGEMKERQGTMPGKNGGRLPTKCALEKML